MLVDQLVGYLDNRAAAENWLRSLGVDDLQRGHANLVSLARSGITLDLLAVVCRQLAEHLPLTSDPGMALNNLDRFVAAARSPLALGSLWERDETALPILLQILSTSQHLSEILIRDPESYDLLRITEGQPVAREVLTDEMAGEVTPHTDDAAVMAILRRYKRRDTLRIAYGDIVRGQNMATVTRQISFLADAICQTAVEAAHRRLEKEWGVPRRRDGQQARFVFLGLGKLGGIELNYSSDIDLIALYESDGETDGPRRISNHEYFDRLTRHATKLLTEPTALGIGYRVDLRLRPEGSRGPVAISLDSAMHYYDVMGRTWERQAFVKARPVAGDLDLGHEFLKRLEPWIYRRYLSRADITGIKALKRRIEQRARREEGDTRNVKTGHGGIRDIEFVIQFLQLLHGGDLVEVRTGNTLDAIAALERVGCLTTQERSILEENYSLLRKIEHRLQILFDLQTHTLPSDEDELRKLAIRMGYRDTPSRPALAAFRADFKSTTELNRKILDHLLHDAFGDEEKTEPEVDLVLDPNPSERLLHEVLGRHGFRDTRSAYAHLMALANERIPFLSTRRCRHFLAAIAPKLLAAIAQTPDPDATLVDLSRVSDSLGGKGVLWELFSFNPPSLQLYVRLCATSPYLSGILTSNPGMIDELMDSLLVEKLPTPEWLEATLGELCRGAADIDPILHSFKNAQHLRVGVRDILGKEDIRDTHAALSDVAEVCLRQITQREYEKLAARYGEPICTGGPNDGQIANLVIVAMGKLGGREPNYHSDLDVVFLFDADGSTRHRRSDQSTSNQHFFSQLGQRIIKVVTQLGPWGRLYELDPRLRPTGKSGALAVSLAEFDRYFAEGPGQLWERQALCKARPVFGTPEAVALTMQSVRRAILGRPWRRENVDEIRHMRQRLEETATRENLKRGSGGTVDIEFAVQMLQLKHAARCPEALVPNTLDGIAALAEAGHLGRDDAEYLAESYRFLRTIESRLRLMNTTARHDLPHESSEVKRLAYMLGNTTPGKLLDDAERYTAENRRRFDRLCEQAAGGNAECRVQSAE
jgi:glutamate-ammonia-ligase adenylyltransferase